MNKNNTARLGGVFLDALKGRKGEKEMGIPKLLFGPKVQRRENVGGSLKTLGPLWSNDCLSFDDSKCNTQNAICQVFCQKNFFVCVFIPKNIGIQTIKIALNQYVISISIKLLDWKAKW